MKFENSVFINQPIETVFDFVTDVRNNHQWQTGVIDIRLTSVEPSTVGSTYHCVNRFLGKRIESETIIIDYDHPYRCSFKIQSDMISGESSFFFTSVNGGTKFTTTGELNLDYFSLAKYIVSRKARHQLKKDMTNLKHILENGGGIG